MDAIVIGGGHAGLGVSQQLGKRGLKHVVLERGRIGESWRSLRWDSFALDTPSWMNHLPGQTATDLADPVDGMIDASGRPLPPLEDDEANVPFGDDAALDAPERLDLARAGGWTVIWATGVSGGFSYLPDGATDGAGSPSHARGAAAIEGIEYIGLPWLTKRGSGIINGIRGDAAIVAERVAARAEARARRA